MLVLTLRPKKRDQLFVANLPDGQEMSVRLLSFTHWHGRVTGARLGIEAPQDVRIARQTIADREEVNHVADADHAE